MGTTSSNVFVPLSLPQLFRLKPAWPNSNHRTNQTFAQQSFICANSTAVTVWSWFSSVRLTFGQPHMRYSHRAQLQLGGSGNGVRTSNSRFNGKYGSTMINHQMWMPYFQTYPFGSLSSIDCAHREIFSPVSNLSVVHLHRTSGQERMIFQDIPRLHQGAQQNKCLSRFLLNCPIEAFQDCMNSFQDFTNSFKVLPPTGHDIWTIWTEFKQAIAVAPHEACHLSCSNDFPPAGSSVMWSSQAWTRWTPFTFTGDVSG